MSEHIIWQAEVKFKGTPAEFSKLAAVLEDLPVEVIIPEWQDRPHHLAGCMPLPLSKLISEDILKRIIKEAPAIDIRFIRDIYGGIRVPHVHLDENRIALLNREQFKQVAGEVARNLAMMRAEAIEDYIHVMDPIDRIAPTPL